MAEIWNMIDRTTGAPVHRWEIDITEAEITAMPTEQIDAFIEALRGVAITLGIDSSVAPGVIGKGTA